MIKKLLYIIPILLLLAMSPGGRGGADQPDFPLIYIDEGCAGTHVGSLANPYDDLNDINWTTGGDNSIFDYLADDPSASPTVHLMKDDSWRRAFVPGCDGTATYPIIITSYGDGAMPIIDADTIGDPAITLSVDYITVKNLDLTADDNHTLLFLGSNHCIVQDCDIHDSGWAACVVKDDGEVTTDSNQILNNNIYDAPHENIYLSNNTAINGVTNTLIQGNTIYDAGDEHIQNTFGASGTAAPSGTIIRGNTIYGTCTDIGQMHLSGDVLVERNNITGSAGDYGGIFIEDSDGAIIRYNLIYDIEFNTATVTAGINFRDTAQNTSVYNNTVYAITNIGAGDGIGIHCANGGTGAAIVNNCVQGCDDQMMWYPATPPALADYNCVNGTCSDTGTNAITVDPLMTDPGSDDFTLNPHSPCVNAGTDVGLTEDYQGLKIRHAPDIGAHENQASAIFLSMIRFITGGK